MIFIAVAVTFARTIDVQLLGGSWRNAGRVRIAKNS
jgi:hypothetical protein